MTQTILQSWASNRPMIRSTEPKPIGEGVLDASAFNTIEVDEVFGSVNYAKTTVGQAVVYRSLTHPENHAAPILEKQAAIKEIKENPAIRENCEQIISQAAETEQDLYQLLFGEFLGSMGTVKEQYQIEGYGYKQYRKGIRCPLNLVESIYSSEKPGSDYLQSIFDKINQFSQSRVYSLMLGPVYNTEQGLKTKQERKGSFIPATIFKPHIFKPLLISLVLLLVWTGIQFLPAGMIGESRTSISILGIFIIPLSLVYFPVVGSYDRDNCIIPLRDEFKQSNELALAMDALGQLDELISFIKFSENYGSDMVLPEILEKPHHCISLVEAKNPVLGKQNEHYVGNDFAMEKEKLVFITGPNSGGKTAFCKTVTQIQLLAQIGCFIPARSGSLTVADHIYYQAPEISHLDDGEGRFGTELKRTKAIFLNSTAKSLIVLDELSEGTTFEEKMESSTHVLDGFYRKGCNTILITHNHQLVDVFVNKNEGVAKQVEFANEQPTYKLIAGVSRVSHADRVAKKIGFSKEDIDGYLANSDSADNQSL